jgi:hypothetical protein|tara:strand:- start:1568 stop:2398 length:831 start_codon:yes stop_codon:yes gene_type:complete
MPINEIQNIQLNNAGIPNITIRPVGNNYIGVRPIQHNWVYSPYSALPIEVPVTTLIGTPIVNMPGCVKVNKENAKNPVNKNKQLVNDDPKQNVVLCDGGMPYYEPPEYDARELSWQTVYVEPEEAEGIDTGEPLTPPSPDVEPPKTPGDNKKEVECPPKNARRIGDRNQKGDEQVKEYKLTPDGLICETIWEPVPTIEQFVPNAGQVSTTAAIAVIATASAAATPLLLRVIKPIIKKATDFVKKKFGKKVTKPTRQDIITDEYRKKKGLPPRKPTS